MTETPSSENIPSKKVKPTASETVAQKPLHASAVKTELVMIILADIRKRLNERKEKKR